MSELLSLIALAGPTATVAAATWYFGRVYRRVPVIGLVHRGSELPFPVIEDHRFTDLHPAVAAARGRQFMDSLRPPRGEGIQFQGSGTSGGGAHPPESAAVAGDELQLAVRAVLVHTAQDWPGGVYCSSDRSPFPCRLRRWGERVLRDAGWSDDDIAALLHNAEEGTPPRQSAADQA
jgi:hypothetical protein